MSRERQPRPQPPSARLPDARFGASAPSPPPGAERAGVRWGNLQYLTQDLDHAVEVVDDLIVPEADHAIAVSGQLGGARRVGLPMRGVLAAVELDRQLQRGTGEVDDTPADRMLPPELPRQGARPEGQPEALFDVGGVAAKPACQRRWASCSHRLPTSPRPSPPQIGRAS